MNKNVKEFINIEEEFFELDKENKITHINLEFNKPSDIFDINSITKVPILSDDFIELIQSSFELAPRKYKIHLTISFDDLEGYDNDSLQDIFNRNMMLEFKRNEVKANTKNKIAISLICIGLLFFIAMLLISNLWHDGGVLKEIFTYIADIATTVTFWEAMTILVVENKERRTYMKNLYTRFDSIEFKKKDTNL